MKRLQCFLFLFAVILLFIPVNTAAMDFNLSVEEKLWGELRLSYPSTVWPYSIVSIVTSMKNIGSTGFNETMETHIFNLTVFDWETYNWTIFHIDSYYDYTYFLNPGETHEFTINFVPVQNGLYLIKANATYARKHTILYATFCVYPCDLPYVPPVTPPEIPTPPALPPPKPIAGEEGSASMTLNYTHTITVTPGESRLVYIMVKNPINPFGNASLTNVMFFAKSMGIPFDVLPKKISRIRLEDYSFFLVTLNVPIDIESGSYYFDFTVTSDQVEKTGSINVIVEETEEEIDLQRRIDNYLFIIERLKWETAKAYLEGANTTKAEFYLKKAESAMEDAIEMYKISDFGKTRSSLDLARSHIERTVIELALAKEKLFMVALPAYIDIALLLFIILLIMTLLFFIFFRRRKKEKERRQEQQE